MKMLFKIIVIEMCLLVSTVFFIFCVADFQEANLINNYNLFATNENKTEGDFLLTDMYDSDTTSIYDFFSQKNSLSILESIYDELTSMEIDYYEISMQSFDYIGKVSFGKEFTDGEDSEQLNQINLNGQIYTPLKSLQISDFVAQRWALSKKIDVLDRTEYKRINSNKIGVFMGYNYKKYFNCGDEFDILYLGEKQYECIVVGFFKEGTTVLIDGEAIALDNYIVSQNMEVKKDDADEYKKVLLSVKCEGYAHYDNQKEREEVINYIQELKETTGFMYEVPKVKKKADTFFGMGYLLATLLLMISVVILLIVTAVHIKMVIKVVRSSIAIQCVLLFLNISTISCIAWFIAISIGNDYAHLLENSLKTIVWFMIVLYIISAIHIKCERKNLDE